MSATKVPAGQPLSHALDPALDEDPAGQLPHVALPPREKVPSAQVRHAAAPSLGAYFPPGHAWGC